LLLKDSCGFNRSYAIKVRLNGLGDWIPQEIDTFGLKIGGFAEITVMMECLLV
jgi:hypothetical protein